ncbi:unnamed protein product, partial [Polarella glacialis]
KLLLSFGVIFWSVPCAGLQSYSVNLVPTYFHRLLEVEDAVDVDGFVSFLRSLKKPAAARMYLFLMDYLPVLALMGLLQLLPQFFEFLSRVFEGYKMKSEIQRVVLGRFFMFQVATLYFTVVGGSLSANLCQIIQKPDTIFSILQEQVPQVACYFITYVATRTGLSLPMLLLFPVLNPLFDCSCNWRGFWRKCCCCFRFRCPCFRSRSSSRSGSSSGSDPPSSAAEDSSSAEDASSAKSFAEPPSPVRPNYALEASNLGMVMVLGLTYACVAPAIMPICMAYFALGSLVYRWLFLYVYTPEFDCSGGIWYELFDGCMQGLVFSNLSIAAFSGAYVGPSSPEFYASLVLAGISVALYRTLDSYYAQPSKFMSFRDARDIDRRCDAEVVSALADDYYIDPVIKQVVLVVPTGDETSSSGAGKTAGLLEPSDPGCCRRLLCGSGGGSGGTSKQRRRRSASSAGSSSSGGSSSEMAPLQTTTTATTATTTATTANNNSNNNTRRLHQDGSAV